jgi:CDP-diacylglycerol--serine O-phosphatidyltransferase
LRFIGFYDYTVILTYASLASAILGIFEASKGNLRLAVLCIIGSGLCDMFDGVVARSKKNRTQDQKNFGIQIDSLVDVIAFGVTPAAVFYFHGVNSTLGVAILIFYVMCGVIRLGFFNVLETKRQSNPEESACLKAFRGMPITFSAIITPIVCFIGWCLPSDISIWLYYIAPALMAFFFVFDISIPKLDVGKLLFGKKK